MERQRKARLCVCIKKSSFHQREVEFLEYKISDRGNSKTSTKVEEIRGWSTPEKDVNLQSSCALLTSIVGLYKVLAR